MYGSHSCDSECSSCRQMTGKAFKTASYFVLKLGIPFTLEGNLVGRCGLYCGACTIYRAYKDDGEFRDRVAAYFKCPPEKVRCEGCQALTSECWGNDCKIVQCTTARGFSFCYECPQFDAKSCEKFEDVAKRYTEDNIDVRANLSRIKAGQVETWLNESRERFRCHYCRKPLPEGSKKCYHCGKTFEHMI